MRRKAYALGALIAALAVTGTVLAFYPGSGSGSASATAGTTPLGVTVDVAITPQAGDPDPELYPGDVADVEITVSAPAEWPAQRRARIGTVDATVDAGSLPVGCEASWFAFTAPSGTLPAFVTAAAPLVLAGGTLEFVDEELDQSACSSATLDLDVVVSGP